MVLAGAVAAARAESTTEKGRRERFGQSDRDNLEPALFQGFQPEVFAYAEGDEGQGHVRQKVCGLHEAFGGEPEDVRPEEDPGQDVGGDVGKTEELGQAGG